MEERTVTYAEQLARERWQTDRLDDREAATLMALERGNFPGAWSQMYEQKCAEAVRERVGFSIDAGELVTATPEVRKAWTDAHAHAHRGVLDAFHRSMDARHGTSPDARPATAPSPAMSFGDIVPMRGALPERPGDDAVVWKFSQSGHGQPTVREQIEAARKAAPWGAP